MKILGIDYGTKRIGIALSDENAQFALPYSVLPNQEDVYKEIERIAKENNVTKIVMGESKNYKGEPNKIFPEIQKLKAQLEKMKFDVFFEPEFMSSVQAQRLQGKNDMLDASAAAVILQSYLDRK